MQLSKSSGPLIHSVEEPQPGSNLDDYNALAFQLPDLNRRDTGGGERNRTDDPLRAKQVLSQLSYTPEGARYGGPGKT